MTRAYVPDRDLPNFQGKQHDVNAAMVRLRERVMVGKFLHDREIDVNRTAVGSPVAAMPDRQEDERQRHDQHHKLAARWARVPREEWCGICVLGHDVWSRYEAGLIQPIAPTEDVPEPVEVKYPAPERPAPMPHLPIEGFHRGKNQ